MQDIQPILLRAQRGDRRALNELVERCHRRVFNTAYKYFSDAELAEEMTQQAFVTLQEKLPQLRDPATFRTWLYRIVTNQCHEYVRKRKTRRTYENQFGFMQSTSAPLTPAKLYEQDERARLVHAALQQLPDNQREVIILKEYEGLKFREIAELLNESENTVKSRMYYGLKALRRMESLQQQRFF